MAKKTTATDNITLTHCENMNIAVSIIYNITVTTI